MENNKYIKEGGIKLGKLKLTIDPGHGGYDSGAVGLTREKDEVLIFSKALGRKLQSQGVVVDYTRGKDVYKTLGQRTAIANSNKSDGFVSIHFNSSSSNAAGTETFHFPNSTKGKQKATKVQNSMIKQNVILRNRGVKNANFFVLRNTKKPAILVELAFINNREDMQNYHKHFDKFVDSVCMGILDFYGIPYKEKPITVQPPKEPIIPPSTDLVLLGEPLKVPGKIVKGKTYVSVDKAYVTSSLIKQNEKPIVEKNVLLGLVEIFKACGLYTEWDNKNKRVIAGLSKDLYPTEDYIEVDLLGSRVRIKSQKVKSKNYIIVGDFAIELRGFFEKIGLIVDWDSKEDRVIITK